MNAARKILLIGGLLLLIWSMAYGLWYALFAEHQDLTGMGVSVTDGFVHAADRKMAESSAAFDSYAETRFRYVRQVDVHSHWGGLALLLIVFGAVFDRVALSPRTRTFVAVCFVLGSTIFPLGVILQVLDRGTVPKAVAVLGSALIIIAMALTALGFARGRELASESPPR